MQKHPDPRNPTDTPLRTVIDRLEGDCPGQFRAEVGGMIRCLTCGELSPASEHAADRVRRIEGASDPGDEVMVVPLECPHCGTRGTLVLPYGPEASAEEVDAVLALSRRPRS